MKLSVLELSTIMPKEGRQNALANSISFAKFADKLGFHRFWIGEHHNSNNFASQTPEVLMSAVAANTNNIRVGSGPILLNYYSPRKIAETFCTLNELFPNRIDLGIGRSSVGAIFDFAMQQDRSKVLKLNNYEQIVELISWLENSFEEDHPFCKFPITLPPSSVSFHLLGSSLWSAQTAGELGLSFSFGAFLNHSLAKSAIIEYKKKFQAHCGKTRVHEPKIILGIHVVCADTEKVARELLAPIYLRYKKITENLPTDTCHTSEDAIQELGFLPKLEKYEKGSGILPHFIAGTPDMVSEYLYNIGLDLSIDEIIIQDMITDFQSKLHSYQLIANNII